MTATRSVFGKPQFGPWLIEQVHSGRYEGLRMISNDTFRIPWKHNRRTNLGEDDIKIFKEWAVVSGKIKEYPNDKSTWKRNFRCALNSLKNFQTEEDHSKDRADPHKIYRILHPENHRESQDVHSVQNQPPIIAEMYNPTDYTSEEMEFVEQDLLNQMDTMALNQQHAESQPWETYSQQNIQTTPINCFKSPDSGVQNTPPPVHQPYPTAHQENLLSITDLEISINYRKMEIFKTRLSSPLVQFYYQCDPTELRGQHIRFPSTDCLTDHKQIHYTKEILNSVGRGLQLEISPHGISAFRQDKCKVFVSTSDPAKIQNPEPRKLRQNFKEQLFSFDKYIRDLKEYQENKRGSPDYTIYLCFGEQLPDGKPLEKKLVVVKVVPLICQELHVCAQLEGASSLQDDNVSLQISHNSLYDLINSLGLPSGDMFQQ